MQPPDPERPDLEELAALDFLAEYCADREAGRLRALSEYLQRHGAFERRIAAEWVRLQGGDAAVAESATPAEPTSVARPSSGVPQGFRIVRELGRGAQGIVYLAHDERVGREVALKILRSDVGRFGAARTLRFRREVAAVARLDHPCLCAVFDAGADEAGGWIAMKLVEGESLEQRLARARVEQRGGLVDRDEIAAAALLVERLADGLAHAHATGLVHRDIKPGNVLLGADGVPVLVDFGLARAEESTDAAVTMPGTISYLAPELLRDRRADVRSDVWSLGACLYELLTLQRPFVASTVEGELRARASQPIGDVRRLAPAVPRDLAAIVATAVAVEPERRYASAAAFAADLARFRRREPVAARAAGRLLVLRRWTQRNPALAASLAALVVVGLVAFVVTLSLLSDTRAALADVTRLADLDACAELIDRAAQLHPLREERIAGPDGMDAWLRDAATVLARRNLHEAALVRVQAQPAADVAKWQQKQLESLLVRLDALAKRREQVVVDREFARTIRARSIDERASAWRETCEAIAASPRYGGLHMAPQIGLVPLGPDVESGLFEFAHLESGTPPVRDPGTGKLPCDAASAIVFVLLPGGSCVLGAENAARAGEDVNVDPDANEGEGPCFRLRLEPFFLAKYELTQAQWRRHTGESPSNYKADSALETIGDENPVEQVSWTDVDRALREMGLCVPSEAQWEYACRAGTRGPFGFGDTKESLAGHANLADADARREENYTDWKFELWLHDGHMLHTKVGSYEPNGFGLFDMCGNVKEWCADSWENYVEAPPRDGDGYRFGRFEKYRVIRGGSYSTDARQARPAYRMGLPTQSRISDVGARAARALDR